MSNSNSKVAWVEDILGPDYQATTLLVQTREHEVAEQTDVEQDTAEHKFAEQGSTDPHLVEQVSAEQDAVQQDVAGRMSGNLGPGSPAQLSPCSSFTGGATTSTTLGWPSSLLTEATTFMPLTSTTMDAA